MTGLSGENDVEVSDDGLLVNSDLQFESATLSFCWGLGLVSFVGYEIPELTFSNELTGMIVIDGLIPLFSFELCNFEVDWVVTV